MGLLFRDIATRLQIGLCTAGPQSNLHKLDEMHWKSIGKPGLYLRELWQYFDTAAGTNQQCVECCKKTDYPERKFAIFMEEILQYPPNMGCCIASTASLATNFQSTRLAVLAMQQPRKKGNFSVLAIESNMTQISNLALLSHLQIWRSSKCVGLNLSSAMRNTKKMYFVGLDFTNSFS